MKLKIVLLADKRWIHTINWVNALSSRGHDVHLISMQTGVDILSPKVKFHRLPFPHPWGYLLNVLVLRKLLKEINPDILNTHYASGYGTLGMLAGYRPNALSVWGSDVYEFPEKSMLHKRLIIRNLNKATAVFSTSVTMANRVKGYLGYASEVHVTPFGIDLDKFRKIDGLKKDKIVIGTVKKLEKKYGIDVLLQVFFTIMNKLEDDEVRNKLEFLIVGGGSEEESLKFQAKELGLQDKITFTGHVPHNEVPKYLSMLDIYYALSTSDSETFGVAVLEASACSLPVIVSDRGGLWEVVKNGETGYIFNVEHVEDIAMKSINLIADQTKRDEMGKNGRNFVESTYSWNATLDGMLNAYEEVLKINE